MLVEALGIEPSPASRELEQSILRQEAGAGAPTPPPEPESPVRRRSGGGSPVSSRTSPARPELGERLDPEILRPLLIRCRDTMQTVCKKYGGAVHDSIGDGVVAVSGPPIAHEDDALRAVLAAVELRTRLVELSAELEPGLRRRAPRPVRD